MIWMVYRDGEEWNSFETEAEAERYCDEKNATDWDCRAQEEELFWYEEVPA